MRSPIHTRAQRFATVLAATAILAATAGGGRRNAHVQS